MADRSKVLIVDRPSEWLAEEPQLPPRAPARLGTPVVPPEAASAGRFLAYGSMWAETIAVFAIQRRSAFATGFPR